MTATQQIFDPIDYGFRWVGDWYEFDRADAIAKAKKARDDEVRELKAEGIKVRKFSLANQMRTMGGIGTDHPQIEEIVNCYGYNVVA